MQRKGFTLVEVLLVVIIVAILAAIVLPRVTKSAEQARNSACKANMAAIDSQAELWKLNTGNWPSADYSDLFDSVNYFPDGGPTCPVLAGDTPVHSSAYKMDATTNRVDKTEHP